MHTGRKLQPQTQPHVDIVAPRPLCGVCLHARIRQKSNNHTPAVTKWGIDRINNKSTLTRQPATVHLETRDRVLSSCNLFLLPFSDLLPPEYTTCRPQQGRAVRGISLPSSNPRMKTSSRIPPRNFRMMMKKTTHPPSRKARDARLGVAQVYLPRQRDHQRLVREADQRRA
jgi:hypothetical protein